MDMNMELKTIMEITSLFGLWNSLYYFENNNSNIVYRK
jgi:hypothetical protein